MISLRAALLSICLSALPAASNPGTAPVLIAPAKGAADVGPQPLFSWHSVPNFSSYHIQVTSGFDSLFIAPPTIADVELSDTLRESPPLIKGIKYFWRVATVDGSHVLGPWSEIRSFTTFPDPPNVPTPMMPMEGATEVDLNPNFMWMLASGDMHIQIATDTGFSAIAVDDSGFTGMFRTEGPLLRNTTYYWRSRAKNLAGVSAWTARRSFTTQVAPLGPPVPLGPPDKAPGVPTTSVTIFWMDTNTDTAAGVKSYTLQVTTDSTFPPSASIGFPMPPYVFNGVTTFPDHQQLSAALPFNTRYYWRVMVTKGAKSSIWSKVFSFTTQPPPPTSITLITPSHNAVDVPLTPTLHWHDDMPLPPPAPPMMTPSSWQVSIATDTTFPPFVFTSGGPMPPYVYQGNTVSDTLTPGVVLARGTKYYWRVMVPMNGIAGMGGGNGSYALDSFTTIPNPPDAVVLTSPADGSVDFLPGGELKWNAAARATQYRFEIADDSNFTTGVRISDLQFPDVAGVRMTTSHTYYWHVKAKNGGGEAAWSPTWSFTTAPPPPPAPALVSPADNSTGVTVSPSLQWSGSAGATSYQVQLSADSAFATTLVDENLTATDKTVGPLAKGIRYFWRVRAKNAGGAGDWSQLGHFTTELPAIPAPPALVAPADNATGVTVTPTLRWSAAAGADSYRVQLSLDSNFAVTLLDAAGLADTAKASPTLLQAVRYFWRARAKNLGGESDWSVGHFTTEPPPPPPAPALIAPAAALGNVQVNPSLSWHSSAGASVYHVQVSALSDFSVLASDVTGPDTSLALSGLANDVTYHWRVYAINLGGPGAPAASDFTTIVALPGAVSLVTPHDGDTLKVDSLMARWHQGGPKADRYWVEISSDSSFATKASDTSVTDTAYAIHQAAANGKYWWRVKAHNAAGWGAFGSARWFIVELSATAIAEFSLRSFEAGGAALHYSLAREARVLVRLFDYEGKLRSTPFDERQGWGNHAVTLEPALLPRGLYILRFEAGGFRRDVPLRWGR